MRVEPPALELKAGEPDPFRPSTLSQRDYLEREARNRSLGLAGEEFIVQYERWRLIPFRLYRVFGFRQAPRLFELRGRPDRHCRLDPTTYRASFS